MRSSLAYQIGYSSLIPQNQLTPPLRDDNRRIKYRNQAAVATGERDARWTVLPRAWPTGRTHGWERIRTWKQDTGFIVSSDVDKYDSAREEDGVVIPAT